MLYFTQRMAAFCAHATSQPIASKLGAGLVAGSFFTSQLYAASAEAKTTTTTPPDLTENDDTSSQASPQVEYAHPNHFWLTLVTHSADGLGHTAITRAAAADAAGRQLHLPTGTAVNAD